MMQANELRIGNWFDCPKGNYTDQGFCKVFSINERGVNGWQDMGASGRADFEDIEPIPLTSEILEKAGFEKAYNFDEDDMPNYKMPQKKQYRTNHEIYVALNGVTYDEGIYIYSGLGDPESYGFKVTHIKYVHQLQNLYFALTGEELKIELGEPLKTSSSSPQ